MKNIAFDMDGTIADFYGVPNWLEYLQAENVYPYEVARPLVNLSRLARRLNILHEAGWNVGIVSWTSKNGSSEYNEAVKQAKRKWLTKHLPSVQFDFVCIIPYGTPKHLYSTGILFDDEKPNRDAWGAGAYDETKIFEVLGSLG